MANNEALKTHIVSELEALRIYEIASNVEVPLRRLTDEEGNLSNGAQFLNTVRVVVAEYVQNFDGDIEALADFIRDEVSSIADYSVPVYTSDVFEAMLDLHAFNEDIEEFTNGTQSIEDMAKIALWVIGEREVSNMADFIAEVIENYEEN